MILIAFVSVVMMGFIVLTIANRPLSKDEMNAMIGKDLEEMVRDNDEITSALLTIYSDKLELDETYAAGYTGNDLIQPVTAEHSYYSASIGKTFTATLIGMLCEEGVISYDDAISKHLGAGLLEGLFVYDGVDYKDRVTIRQLLGHMSGIGDYYEDPVLKGETMLEILINDGNKRWNPIELVAFTRENQRAVARPGEVFHYSDTGYILLGFLIEAVTGQQFHEVLHERIFDPLGMNDTYLIFQSNPKNNPKFEMLEVYVNGIDVSDTNALSFDWSGGGLVTTMADLLKFSKALIDGKLVDIDVFHQMTNFSRKYMDGVYYGLGMMEFRFGEFSYFQKDIPNLYGGVGDSSTFMLYDKSNDIHIIANFGSIDLMEESVPFLAEVLMTVDRLDK